MGENMNDLIEKVKAKDFQSLAKLLTSLEKAGPALLKEKELLEPQKPVFRVGITGPPGAGKSTLIGQLIKAFRAKNLSVGVLAVDPSSPFTRGAILGDRIRYSEFIEDEEVFVRSVGSRGSLGGLSASTYLMLRAYDLCPFDVVLIETVGVGQTELEIMHVADFVSVVLVPESGDSIQAMKAGLLEIADHFIVNKSDRPGADAMVKELESSVHLGTQEIKVSKTTATENKGVDELVGFYLNKKESGLQKRNSKERLRWEASALLRLSKEQEIEQLVEKVDSPQDLQKLF